MESLRNLRATTYAIQTTLEELDEQYEKGAEDIGRVTRMKNEYKTKLFRILDDIEKHIKDDDLRGIITKCREGGNDEETKEKLKNLAKKRGWPNIVNFIDKCTGHIIEVVARVAVRIVDEHLKQGG